jgi:hypothetical protein
MSTSPEPTSPGENDRDWRGAVTRHQDERSKGWARLRRRHEVPAADDSGSEQLSLDGQLAIAELLRGGRT